MRARLPAHFFPRKEHRMKGVHVHVATDDLDANIRFYSAVFSAAYIVV